MTMTLQTFLEQKFKIWKPEAPIVTDRTKCSITLDWRQQQFRFLEGDLLYRIEVKKKLPPWVVVYSGGKTCKLIDYLPPRHPHVFRLTVILNTAAVSRLAQTATNAYGDEKAVREALGGDEDMNNGGLGDTHVEIKREVCWLESLPSEETWTSTDTDGSSAVCFCMAVCCGYIKQVQSMLEERPELIDILNPTSGFTPLAGAVRKGDLNTVKFLLSAGAEVEQRSASGQTPLHLAVLAGHVALATLLLEHGAQLQTRDINQLRAEHYAVDSGSVEMLRFILERGGELEVRDSNGWTLLFRALTQNASTEMIAELMSRGADADVRDAAGLPLLSVARLLTNRHGHSRDSILRLVDRQFPHERALAIFTRVSKKIHHVHSVFKP